MELDTRSVCGISTPLYLRVTGVTPRERVRVSVSAVDAHNQPWSSSQAFRADAAGVVNIASLLPESAEWEPAHSLGLLWSMRPDASGLGDDDAYVFDLQGLSPIHLHIRVRVKGQGLGALVQRTIARDVHKFEGPGGREVFSISRAPGVVLLAEAPPATGSASAAALAHHRFTTLYAPNTSSIDVLREFHASEHVDSDVPLALVAYGRACAIAFDLATRYPDLIGPVVAHSPSDVDFPLPSWSDFRRSRLTGKPARLSKLYASARETSPPISLEGMVGPLLLTAGTRDAIWNSAEMSLNLEQSAKRAGIETFRVVYEKAGHTCGYPFTFPGLPTSTIMRDHGHRILVGGKIDANGRAAEMSRHQVISFLASTYEIPINI
ncbi:MAG: acyl-CoA thioesterase/BAAT N-terminal domain-containing protein [Corynebacterium sp.]|nr:acyl-CoA thioesterase/BAAT N-terminal domain-containing protein [Corynebacterium sp.]